MHAYSFKPIPYFRTYTPHTYITCTHLYPAQNRILIQKICTAQYRYQVSGACMAGPKCHIITAITAFYRKLFVRRCLNWIEHWAEWDCRAKTCRQVINYPRFCVLMRRPRCQDVSRLTVDAGLQSWASSAARSRYNFAVTTCILHLSALY